MIDSWRLVFGKSQRGVGDGREREMRGFRVLRPDGSISVRVNQAFAMRNPRIR